MSKLELMLATQQCIANHDYRGINNNKQYYCKLFTPSFIRNEYLCPFVCEEYVYKYRGLTSISFWKCFINTLDSKTVTTEYALLKLEIKNEKKK